LKFVFDGVGRRIAPQPELFDEFLAFLVGGQLQERVALAFGDDIGDILFQPFAPWRIRPVGLRQLSGENGIVQQRVSRPARHLGERTLARRNRAG